MKRFSIAVAVVMLAGVAAWSADRKVTLKMSNVTSRSGIDAGKVFKEVAERESGGTLLVNVFDNNQLGDDRVVVEGTVFGDIDLVVSSTSPVANMFRDFYAFDAPYLFLDTESAYRALDSEVGQQILADMAQHGLKGLCFWENGFRNFTNSKVAARVPEDIAGMKIRCMENDIQIAAWRALGANPTPMAFTEVFTALQQGTVDGQENPLGIIDGNKFDEVQKYLSLTQHVYTPYFVAMNLEKFESLSEAQQNAILAATRESLAYQRARSQELEGEIVTRFGQKGEVVHLTQDEKKQWQARILDAKVHDLVKGKMANPDYFDKLMNN